MPEIDPKLRAVVEMALSAVPVEIGCDDCYELMASYADHVLAGKPLDDARRLVDEHLKRCACCREEFELLLAALNSSPEK